MNSNRPEISQLEGFDALAFYCGLAVKKTEIIFKSLPRMVETTGVEALILDPIQFFVELAAMKLRIPYIDVSTALYIDYWGYMPPSIYDWPHETTPEALIRNQKGIVKGTRLTYNEGIKAYAKENGLKTDLDRPSWIFSELAHITQIPKEVDFENPLLPPQFHYTGPFHDGKGRPNVEFPWDRLTGEPLIYASMGTIMNGQLDVFRTIVAGVAKHKGTQLVLSIGEQLDPKQIGPAPSNAIIVNQTPQGCSPVVSSLAFFAMNCNVRVICFINAHKILVPAIVLGMMYWFHNWSTEAFVYLGLHGTYAMLWLVKSAIYPDKSFQESRLPFWAGALLFCMFVSGYNVAPYMLLSRQVLLRPWVFGFVISAYTIGMFLHFVGDAQKYYTLRLRPGLIEDGLFERTRNPNYLGETLIYLSLAIVSWHWLSFLALGGWLCFYLLNMLRKDRSLARYPNFAAYKARTGMLLPSMARRFRHPSLSRPFSQPN